MAFSKKANKPLGSLYDNQVAINPSVRKTILINAPSWPCAWPSAVVMDEMVPTSLVEQDYETTVHIDGKTLAEWRTNPTYPDQGLNSFDGTRTASAKSNV